MTNLIPIKVKIGLKVEGGAKYPDFNALQVVQDYYGLSGYPTDAHKREGKDWSKYIDVEGSGWLYDSIGHQEENVESPLGQQWGLILVPKKFADESISMFPNEVTKMTKVECITFYDTKHAVGFDDEEIDTDKLAKIEAKEKLGITLSKNDLDARNPSNDIRGIRKNWRKKWDDYKKKKGFNVV